MIHQIDSKNEWSLLTAVNLAERFTAKFGLVFILTLENAFFRGLVLKSTERAYVLLKNSTRDFQNSPPFKRPTCFYVTISGNFECFQYFNSETDFLESENFFQKTGANFFH